MPLRSDIESVLVIGSGPIVIGQACEFDYSGTQDSIAVIVVIRQNGSQKLRKMKIEVLPKSGDFSFKSLHYSSERNFIRIRG